MSIHVPTRVTANYSAAVAGLALDSLCCIPLDIRPVMAFRVGWTFPIYYAARKKGVCDMESYMRCVDETSRGDDLVLHLLRCAMSARSGLIHHGMLASLAKRFDAELPPWTTGMKP